MLRRALAVLCCVLPAGGALAVTVPLVKYQTAGGTSLSPSFVGTGVTAASLTAGAGLAPVPAATTFEFSGWTTSTSRDPDDVFRWSFSSAQPLDLTKLDFAFDTRFNGPRSMQIEAIVNGAAPVSVFLDTTFPNTDVTRSVDLTALTGVTSVEFVLYGFRSTTGGLLDLEDMVPGSGVVPESVGSAVVVYGEAPVPVPLPAGLPLILLGAGVLGALRLRR